MKYRIILIAIFILAVIFAGGFFILRKEQSPVSEISYNPEISLEKPPAFLYALKIDKMTLNVELADTPEKKEKGLSNKRSLAENQGMLFVFDHPDFYSFWMKDMFFPIDIIWIGKDLKIIDITKDVWPDTYPKNFKPSSPIKYAIEVNAGWILKNEIAMGTYVPLDGISKSFKAEIDEIHKDEVKKSPQIENDLLDGESVLLDVPFTSQAPLGHWSDSRQENGCEEASALMAMAFVRSAKLFPISAEKEIIAIADYETEIYGDFHDTSAEDTVKRIFKGYYKYNNAEARSGISIEDIKKELFDGNLVIVPVNGQKIKNPFYTPPGPLEHMLVVIGYDGATKEFITNDPGTRRGEKYRYSEDVLGAALMDYPTGIHQIITEVKTAMIVVKR